MARVNKDYSGEVIEVYGHVKETDKNTWTKSIVRVSWNDNPSTIDIRNVNLPTNVLGKGISLSDEEADMVVDILLSNDYGNMEQLERALNKKKKRITFSIPSVEDVIFIKENKTKSTSVEDMRDENGIINVVIE